jgi:hypothetical protein
MPPLSFVEPLKRGPVGVGTRMPSMGQFGDAAVLATKLYSSGKACSPREAWKVAISAQSDKKSVRDKVCPKDAYLGLCEAGYVCGIPPGSYGAPPNNLNGRYVVHAYRMIQVRPQLATDRASLWASVPVPRAANENGQLDVLLALLRNGLLV